jgi:hypothetical protein
MSDKQLERRDVSGLWVQGIDEKADSALGDPATHGTYTRSIYLRLVHAPAGAPAAPTAASGHSGKSQTVPGADFQMLYVFDEAAELAVFSWQADFSPAPGVKGAWVSSNTRVTFAGDASAVGTDLTVTVAPNLALRGPKDAAVPKSFRDTGCPMAFGEATLSRAFVPKPGTGIGFETDLNAAMPLEYISFSPEGDKDLVWTQRNASGADVIEVTISPADSTKAYTGDQKQSTWNDVFQASSYLNNDAVFIGYKPMEIDLYNGVLSGTQPELFDTQPMSGRRIFTYPTRDSTVFAKSPEPGKFLPLGTLYNSVDAGNHQKSTTTIASENEHCQSLALSFGLEGGIEGLAKVGVKLSSEEKTEQTSSQQLRYTVSLETHKLFALVRHLPNLALDADYAQKLYAKLGTLVRSADMTVPDLDWNSFEGEYGSHYANAVTFGEVNYLKTILSEKTEGVLTQQSLGLETTASAAFEGFEAKRDAGVTSTWGDKFKDTIGSEEVKGYSLGSATDHKPIFLDLRPVSEVLNPILLPWTPGPLATTQEMRAPFMWYVLRRNWSDYQRRVHQMGVKLSALADVDYTPTIVRFTATTNVFTGAVMGNWPSMYGSIAWSAPPAPVVAGIVGYNVDVKNAHASKDNEPIPGTGNLALTLVLGHNTPQTGNVGLNVAVRNWRAIGPDDKYNIALTFGLDSPDGHVTKGVAQNGPTIVSVDVSKQTLKPAM